MNAGPPCVTTRVNLLVLSPHRLAQLTMDSKDQGSNNVNNRETLKFREMVDIEEVRCWHAAPYSINHPTSSLNLHAAPFYLFFIFYFLFFIFSCLDVCWNVRAMVYVFVCMHFGWLSNQHQQQQQQQRLFVRFAAHCPSPSPKHSVDESASPVPGSVSSSPAAQTPTPVPTATAVAVGVARP